MPELPERKISEAFVDFAAPILELLGPHAEPADLQRALRVAELAWNAVALRADRRGARYLPWARKLIETLPEPQRGACAGLFELLVERREREFGEDPRLVSDVEVWRTERGELRLRASARLATGSSFLG